MKFGCLLRDILPHYAALRIWLPRTAPFHWLPREFNKTVMFLLSTSLISNSTSMTLDTHYYLWCFQITGYPRKLNKQVLGLKMPNICTADILKIQIHTPSSKSPDRKRPLASVNFTNIDFSAQYHFCHRVFCLKGDSTRKSALANGL